MTLEHLKIEKTSDATLVFLQSPAKHNALNPFLLRDLKMAVLEASPNLSLAIASGSDVFSSGLDLDRLDKLWGDRNGLEEYFEMLHALYTVVYAHPAPTIAIVRKGAFGGGFSLACCCDLILADKNSRFVLPGERFGNLARLARPPLMTKLESVELEAFSEIAHGFESAHELGICEDLAAFSPYSDFNSFSPAIQNSREKRLLPSSQENFAGLCKRIRKLVIENLDLSVPPHKWKETI